MPGAIEEFLRVRSPFPRVGRITTREVELGGVTVPAGQLVFAWLGSANRDERQFADPGTVRIERHPNRHLAFGKGIHFCIGAPLARLEAKVALNRLLDRYRNLAVGAAPAYFPPMTMAAAKHLPVAGNLA